MSQGSYNFSGALPLAPFPYLEVAWVCAPNAAGQSISANTETTLTLTDIVRAIGSVWSGVVVSSNQIQNVPAGVYAYELKVPIRDTNNSNGAILIGVHNVSSSTRISRAGAAKYTMAGYVPEANGEFSLSSPSTLDARILVGTTSGAWAIDNGSGTAVFSDSTAGADQRTTLKLRKIG